MKIGVLGTGVVGQTIASKLAQLGHTVKMGSRMPRHEKAVAWAKGAGPNASFGTFAEAAAFGERVWNCTLGMASLQALEAAGADHLKGKVLIDLSNPLDFSNGMPPTLSVCNTDSLGEQIQRAFPAVKVVKTLNTMNCFVMVNPGMIPGDHDVFMSGDDAGAKAQVKEMLTDWFGWKTVIDLGNITTARGTEQLLPIWIRLFGVYGHPNFNFKINKGDRSI